VTAVLVGVPFVLAAAGWGAFSVVGTFAHASEQHQASYDWNGGEISLSVGSGRVTVEAGAGSRVDVSYTEHYELKKPTVSAATADGGLQLNAKCPGGIFGNNCAVNYTLTVPASAHLVVHTGDGTVRISGMVNGVSADTGDGGIHLTDVGGDVVARTGDGGIDATRLRSTSVQAETGDGGIRLEWAIAPTSVTATTGDGGIVLAVPSGSGPYNVSATTGDGRAQVNVPTDKASSSSITAHTGDGGILIDNLSGSG